MTKVVIFSLDYDGCADILFGGNEDDKYRVAWCAKYETRYESLKTTNPTDPLLADPLLAKNARDYKRFAEIVSKQAMLKKQLIDFLHDKAKGADIVEFYIGSNNQSPAIQRFNSSKNKNGSCFANLSQFCNDNGWRFRRLLLADVDHGLPSESVFNRHELCSCDTHKHFDHKKTRILKHQLLEVAENYPSDEVEYYFVDDDPDKIMLPMLRAHFKQKENKTSFEHVGLHLYEFDHFEATTQNKETLKEIAHIPGKQVVAASTLVGSGVTLLFPPAVPANGSSTQVQSSSTTPTSSAEPKQSLASS